ncbi:ABC transporter ATP-binding protein [Altererythrobacter sp. KTW20L]|uniref:ABC transporter ATP-binding protein n=1 Tax=Altererythrobacter sp. KTW20L TaxID=2942210 RepID=UPI0020C0EB87|nr:ABC transporter ATP-binding protein [Altererythrobacter sp. KTW20L]
MEPGPILTLRDVTRRYGAREVVQQAGFTLKPGRITCLLGPSGCGKSTILRLVAGLEPLDEGEIAIGGQTVSAPGLTVPPEQRGVGLVFQDNALFPHLTVRDNVGFGVQSLGKVARQALVDELLARLHVDHLADKWPHTLSGGEQQRVAIARALAREPVLLLLDEPFSGLDGHLRAQIRRSLMLDLQSVGTTVLVVTHDPDEAMAIADDLILMADGRILQTGSPADCYDHPASLVAARLLGDALEVRVTMNGATAASPFGPVPAGHGATLIVRPRDMFIAREGMPATVLSVRKIGHETLATVESEVGEFSIDPGSTAVTAGQAIHLQLRARVPN